MPAPWLWEGVAPDFWMLRLVGVLCLSPPGGFPVLTLPQFTHLHTSEHFTPAWKHSQYFLRQLLFLQWHPFLCRGVMSPSETPLCVIFGVNAMGFRCLMLFRVSSTTCRLASVLQQSWHEQSEHSRPAAKHSQYSFKHFDLRQLHRSDPAPLFRLRFAEPAEAVLSLREPSVAALAPAPPAVLPGVTGGMTTPEAFPGKGVPPGCMADPSNRSFRHRDVLPFWGGFMAVPAPRGPAPSLLSGPLPF
mmetsp:Transcript_14068/g.39980  ORF Transcript_14068/g.39980 Transcript_14068/m.39980 type:complete len:246 (-) Transcript_14068:602-1339(-)